MVYAQLRASILNSMLGIQHERRQRWKGDLIFDYSLLPDGAIFEFTELQIASTEGPNTGKLLLLSISIRSVTFMSGK